MHPFCHSVIIFTRNPFANHRHRQVVPGDNYSACTLCRRFRRLWRLCEGPTDYICSLCYRKPDFQTLLSVTDASLCPLCLKHPRLARPVSFTRYPRESKAVPMPALRDLSDDEGSESARGLGPCHPPHRVAPFTYA